MDLSPGTILLGKYRVDELIGTGGMGRVVRASHLYLHQPVAIKILLAEMAESESTVARFLREAQSTVRLRGEHIARVMDVGTMADRTPFIVMEFLDGNDLNQILRHHGPQSPDVVVDLMLQACEGMAEAHALGIIHRDIKPSNFFITRRPDGSMLLKILDFGISKVVVGNHDLTGTQTVIGTPSYMAPEQMKSGRSCDARSDIWAMGVVMYQLIAGRPPFAGESYAELVLNVNGEPPAPLLVPLPNGLADAILRCLAKDPRDRQQNVGELARMIAPFSTDPMGGGQAAARISRILQHRSAQPGAQGSPLAAGGGLTVPVPISPDQLTPRSWPPSSTSISRGAGQVTLRTRGHRGWLIAGAASLVLIAGAGGYLAASSGGHPDLVEPHVRAPAPPVSPPPPPPVEAAKPIEPPAPPPVVPVQAPKLAVPLPLPTPTPTIAVKPDPAPQPIAKPSPAVAAKAKPAVKADVKPAVKADAKPAVKADAKPAVKAKPQSDDLFDTRH